MLHKSRSTETALMKYGLIAPLFILMIVVSSATLASKELTKIEEKVEDFSEENLEEVIVKPSKTAREVLSEANIDLSDALIISPALANEVTRGGEIKRDSIYNGIDQQAEYLGGMEEFGKYLAKNIKYPAAAQKANYSGKVYIEFIVNKDGTATDFQILKPAEFGCSEEALRVLKSIPKWNAGIHKGEVVNSRFVVPINFQLKEEGKIKINKNDKEEFPKLPAVMEFKGDKSEMISTNVVLNNKCKDCPPPLYIVDGVEGQSDVLKNLDPKNIESISVFNDKKSIEPYGKKGENGVIIITSKKK